MAPVVHSNRLVPDDGFGNESLVIIGEAPGKYEDRALRPFVGPSGYRMEGWLGKVGLSRKSAYWTNVFPYRPLNNAIETIPRELLEPQVERLHQRIAQLTNPIVIVPTGNVALRALTGKAYFPWESRKRGKDTIPGILSHRGSVYSYKDLNGRWIKVIPTIHAAATFRAPKLEKRIRKDWEKIAREVKKGGGNCNVNGNSDRQTFTARTMDDIDQIGDFARRNPNHPIVIDLEWAEGGQVLCVGFALCKEWSMTVPTTVNYWPDKVDLWEAWSKIKEICEGPNPKILHHGHSDAYVLAKKKIHIENYCWDTLAMHHWLDANDDHDLAYLASIFTDMQYWKDEAKDPESIKKYASNFDALCNYNGLDCCGTYELQEIFEGKINAGGVREQLQYDRFYRQMIPRLVKLMLHGVRVDEKKRKRRLLELRRDCIQIQDAITNEIGYELYGKKSLSSKKIAKFLYDDLKLPKKLRTRKRANGQKEKTVTADEVAIRRLMNERPSNTKLQVVGRQILDHRRKYQLSGFYSRDRIDSDGRMRSSYAPYADSGRLRSSANPLGSGSNAQNVDREARDIYIADGGQVFIELDLSLAEDRDVKVRTGSPRLIEQAKLPPWEVDFHKEAAVKIFRTPIQQVTKEQRYLGKRTKHASNYGETGQKHSDELLKDGYIYTAEQCQQMIDLVIDEEVREWQQRVRLQILKFKHLTNSFGRSIDFGYERLSDDLYRRGYAFGPQSDISDHMNQHGFIPYVDFLEETGWGNINVHSHDALLSSVDPEYAYDCALWLRRSLEKPIVIEGVEITIWTELKLGLNWGEMVEWKRFPSRSEFNEQLETFTTLIRNAEVA